MATVTETFKRCEVYGTIKGVRVYSLAVTDDDGKAVWSKISDLSPRALERLKAGLDRMTAPGKKKKVA